MTRAYQVAAISQVSIINYAEIIFAIIFGMLLFSESYNLLTYAGMVMVAVGVVMNFLYTRKSALATS
jgi:drug/metabolite transporter (DMT)-like permease